MLAWLSASTTFSGNSPDRRQLNARLVKGLALFFAFDLQPDAWKRHYIAN